jgi:CheY-like chemotaxis protein
MSASVLFVDDEEKARKYFALALAGDFDVKTAGSAADALAVLAENAGRVAVIVSDQRMPETTGVELLKTVRERYPDIVRLLTTAYTDLEDAIEAINRGEILRYIQKPWDINTLKTELKHALNYFQLRRERDELLQEKLSVRQSMVQIERISQLLLFAEAIPHLRFTGHSMRCYIDQLRFIERSGRSASAPAPASPLLDVWSQTLAETLRMRQFIRTVVDELSAYLPAAGTGGNKFDTLLDLPALHRLIQECAHEAAPSLQVQIADDPQTPAGPINVDAAIFRLTLVKLLAVIHAGCTGNIVARLSATGTPPNTGLQLLLEIGEADFATLHALLSGPVKREIPASCANLLLAFLGCVHHGGSLEIGAHAGGGSAVLSLPSRPLEATLAADDRNWHEDVLATFEPEIF